MRRHNFLFLLPLTFALFLAGSCTLETDGTSKLMGFWHLESVDTLSTNGSHNMIGAKCFWAFQNKLLQVSDTFGVVTLCFENSGSSLTLSKPYWYSDQGVDNAVENAADLNQYGIDSLEQTFTVNKLSGSKMVLTGALLRLHFTKY